LSSVILSRIPCSSNTVKNIHCITRPCSW